MGKGKLNHSICIDSFLLTIIIPSGTDKLYVSHSQTVALRIPC